MYAVLASISHVNASPKAMARVDIGNTERLEAAASRNHPTAGTAMNGITRKKDLLRDR
jgi:hypothetical protein